LIFVEPFVRGMVSVLLFFDDMVIDFSNVVASLRYFTPYTATWAPHWWCNSR